MFGGLGSTWGDNFYMSTQNELELEIWPWGILIYTLELKLRHFEVSPICLYREALYLQRFLCACAVINREYPLCMCTCTWHWRPYPIWSKLAYRLPACIVWLCYVSSYYVEVSGEFFFLSVWAPWTTGADLRGGGSGGCNPPKWFWAAPPTYMQGLL